MKNLIKVILVVGILVAVFGSATVKGWLDVGVDKGVDAIEYGVEKVKDSDTLQQIGSDASSKAKDAVSGFFSNYIGG